MRPAGALPPGVEPESFKMSLFEHLTELRTRLMRVTIAVTVLGFASLIFARPIYGLLMRPVLLALPPDASALVYTSAIEEINVLMKIGLYTGIFLATPVLLWQIWGFVAPGLYENERKLMSPFILSGSLAFLAGAGFCYGVVLPQMFKFLLQKEDAAAIESRISTARLREEDALRFLRLGDLDHASALARVAVGDLEAAGDGQTTEGMLGITLIPKQSVDLIARVEGLGRLIDAARDGLGPEARPTLVAVTSKRVDAVKALGEENWSEAARLADEASALLAGAAPAHTEEFALLWRLEKLLGIGRASADAINWTRPMLSMTEQLTLVLVLELAFGVIFELPLVMMVLGLVGLVKSSFLFKYQRHAFVVCLIVAAVITPTGDAVNLSLMAGPMLLCYELGVLLVWLVEKRRAAQGGAGTPPAK
jgi:sec-independent protein translocase protein TatC